MYLKYYFKYSPSLHIYVTKSTNVKSSS